MSKVLPVVIVGASGHGSVVADVCRCQGLYEILGFIDSFKAAGTKHCGLDVLGTENDLPRIESRFRELGGIVAIGDNMVRQRVVTRICELIYSFKFITAIHPSAQIGSNVAIGAGSVAMAGVVINAGTTIGKHCIINTSASIDHDNVWGDFTSLGPGGTTGGHVTIGKYSVVAQGAVVLHGRRVGAHSVVGASSTVIHDIPDSVVAYGTPAKVVRSRSEDEKYL